MKTLLLIAIRNLLQNRKRSLLLGIAIAMVTALLVLLSSLLNGMQDTMLSNATTLSSGHVNVAGFFKITSGTAAPVVTHYEKLEQVVRTATPGVSSIVERGRGWAKIISDTGTIQAAIAGIDIGRETRFREAVQVETGSLDGLKDPHSVMIFAEQARRLEVKVGDNLTISAATFRGVNNTVDVRVVAIAKNMGMLSSFNVYVHHDSVRELYQLDSSTTGAIQIYLKDADQAEAVAVSLKTAIEKAGYRTMERVAEPFFRKFETVKREDWVGQKVDITTWMDEMKFMRFTLDTVKMLRNILVTILLIIIIIGVMNTLWISIRERTREIGTLRAIGMQRGYILRMFMTEAALLAVAATTTGALLGALIAQAITASHFLAPKQFQIFLMSDTWRLLVDRATVLESLIVITLVTTLGALYPAWKAARLQPVTAMHAS
jgi:ABC-type lipoprotein release transport system permease subunit